MTAIHLRVALGCFVIGVGISALYSTLQTNPEPILPVMIRHNAGSKPDVRTVEWTITARRRKTDLPNTNGKVRSIDFCNFRFPGFYDKQIVLKDGRQEIEREYGGTIYTLHDSWFIDLTGDGREEALVSIEDFSGAGSSSVSYNYYVYTMRSGRPLLLWRVATGSEGLAGPKDFRLEGKSLVFEVFGDSSLIGREITGGGRGGECCPEEFSRITIAWKRGRFRQIKVQVFPLMGTKRR